ncbi:hypothetical protein E2C01_020645 [Portunus trituberculatus]|uniref:Uncharacterized protein n=1 Tax=Portunus trituberculatus TaxID=210409 RepID=A0A5B7E2W5_PORTR|nr:hypothetical protein [Portunus trituberculatus]
MCHQHLHHLQVAVQTGLRQRRLAISSKTIDLHKLRIPCQDALQLAGVAFLHSSHELCLAPELLHPRVSGVRGKLKPKVWRGGALVARATDGRGVSGAAGFTAAAATTGGAVGRAGRSVRRRIHPLVVIGISKRTRRRLR